MKTKACSKCGEVKSLDMYHTKKTAKDGRRSECKKCHSKYIKSRNNKKKENGDKKCSRCEIIKDVSEFGADKSKSDGCQSWCKECKTGHNKQRKLNITEDTIKICKTCHQPKQLKEYHLNASGEYGRQNECADCRSKKNKNNNYKKPTKGIHRCCICRITKDVSEFHADKSSKTGMQSCCIDCGREKLHKWASTLKGYITMRFKDLKNNAKKRFKNIPVNITKQDIHELYKKQKGLCAISGVQMTHTAYTKKWGSFDIIETNLSVDRIDSNKGYTKNNIQLVCAMVNRMKSYMPDNRFIQWCRSIYLHQKSKKNLHVLENAEIDMIDDNKFNEHMNQLIF